MDPIHQITAILDAAGVKRLHPDIGAPARKPMMPQERVQSVIEWAQQMERERNNWEETAAQNQRNTEYYQGIVDQIALMLGEDAFTANDGGKHTSPLRAKVAELVAERLLRLRDVEGMLAYRNEPDLGEWLGADAVRAIEEASLPQGIKTPFGTHYP